MSTTPYLGEIRLWSGSRLPNDWAWCDGRTLAISQYDGLFNLIGTTYGGDGQSTFRLPNLNGRVPLHTGNGYSLGETGGVENVTLTTAQLPIHRHNFTGSVDPATASSLANAVPASMPSAGAGNAWGTDPPYRPLHPSALGSAGGSQAHTNMQPYLTISYMISLAGMWPYQTTEE
ncbi:MAG: phage tail protein [Nocardioidaceae bacterium]|nr:phage tail protein [Nocardioidaceae bacterium]